MTHNLPRVIGLVGYQRAGKTTTAKVLEAQHGYVWTRFAGPLKDMLRTLGLTDQELDGHLKNEPCTLLGGKTPVQAMQTLGTEWGRNMVWADLWHYAWERRAEEILAHGGRVVVDDVRFGNEASLIRDLGGELWRVDRPNHVRGSEHVSEAYVAECQPHLIINNPGDSLEILGHVINRALGVLL